MTFRKLIGFLKPRSIQSHLIHLVLALVAIQIVVSWVAVSNLASNIIRAQIGMRALEISETLALMPSIREALRQKDPGGILQKLSEDVRVRTGAAFVVVGDAHGIRYSHPVKERIGEEFVGGDYGAAVKEGKTYASEALGTLGRSLRGFSPIYDDDSNIIGFVSVGFLIENIQRTIPALLTQPLLFIVFMSLVGIGGAIYIAKHLKKITLGLEPADITNLFLERGAVLEAIREGVIAVDKGGKAILVNQAALRYLGLPPWTEFEGASVDEFIPDAGLRTALRTGRAEYDQERTVNGHELIFNILPVLYGGEVKGAVASFRRKDELDRLAFELSRVQEYAELLRVQTHEYSNKLHAIAGLIQIDARQEALDLVVKESSGYEDMMRFLIKAVPHPVIAAIILGKFNRAKELKLDFTVDRDSGMADVPAWIPQEKIVSILGNLLDNAFDAVMEKPDGEKWIELSFTDLGRDIVFEVEDSGPGVPAERLDEIFRKGVTTKGERRRGLGLFLVKQRLDALGGQITVTESHLGGALFTMAIPKQEGGQ